MLRHGEQGGRNNTPGKNNNRLPKELEKGNYSIRESLVPCVGEVDRDGPSTRTGKTTGTVSPNRVKKERMERKIERTQKEVKK